MRLGARWRVGEPPHPGVPAELHAAIAEQERAHTGSTAWTLTWLEGRPRCELDADASGAGVLVTLSASGEVTATPRVAASADPGDGIVDDDDDWLS